MARKSCRVTATVFIGLTLSTPAAAQSLDVVGNRAAGLAAFVAVADDASAVVWNPSGLVHGPIFNILIDLGRSTNQPPWSPQLEAAAGEMGTTLISIGTTPLGAAYYRLTTTTVSSISPAVTGTPDRQINQRVVVRRLVTNHLGAAVQQSLGDYLTVGATLKLVRGSVGDTVTEVSSWNQAFERADDVPREGHTRADLDVGAMFAAGRMRAGIVVRNATTPTFGDEGDAAAATLDRHVRVGLAWANRWPGVSTTVVALDADLTRVPHAAGERRDVAAGIERWFRGQQVGVRAGVRASTVGDARPVFSGGGSYALRSGVYVDAFVAAGPSDDRAWGLAARWTY